MRTFKQFLFISLFILPGLNSFSQGNMLERYKKAETYLPKNIKKLVKNISLEPHWIGKSSNFWYIEQTNSGTKYMLFNAKTGKSNTAFDHKKMASIFQQLGDTLSADSLKLKSFSFSDDLKSIRFSQKNNTFTVKLKNYTLEKETKEKRTPKNQSKSPDGKWIVSVKDHNLYLKNTASGKETALTTDGIEKYDYATPYNNWNTLIDISKEEQYDPRIHIRWSADSKKFLTFKLDRRKIGLMYLYQSTPDSGYRAKVWAYERAIPGEDAIKQEYFVFNVEQETKAQLNIPMCEDITLAFYPQWMNNSEEIYIGCFKRGYQALNIYIADANTGKAKNILQEQANTMIETQLADCRWINNYQQFLYTSERDGWNHIYLYDKSGHLVKQLTKGNFVVFKIQYIDEKSGTIYFTAGGMDKNIDPYYAQLYRIQTDGSNLKLLTSEKACHEVLISPNGKIFIDNYSTIDTKPVSVVRSLKDGSIINQPIISNIKDLLASGWRFPEPFKVKARDGKTDIYGAIYYPSNFNPDKKYPVIDGTYSGPQAVRTPKIFGHSYRSYDVSFAELGFIVITVDGLGTAMRSKKFHDFSYKNLGDIGAEDHILAIKQLAADRPYLDTTRVGIYGHSAGGYDAVRALLTHPEFYSVGISSAGNHDHRIAKAWWPEQYMGLPGPQYDEQSNFNLAGNLQGHLLLVHGDMDNNVNPASTLRLAGEFIKHNKDFDILIIPNKNHGSVFEVPFFLRKRWDYFVKNLMGENPPLNYQITSYQ